jgi:hypothetical protein
MAYGAEVEVEALLPFATPAFHVGDTQRPLGVGQWSLTTQGIAAAATACLHPNGEIHIAVVLDGNRRFAAATRLRPVDRPLLDESHCRNENREQRGYADHED